MAGFEAIRQVAREAVESVGMRPIMAELSGASAASAQRALLDDVARADVYLLILGERYGTPGASGLSPTEEEFEEAEGCIYWVPADYQGFCETKVHRWVLNWLELGAREVASSLGRGRKGSPCLEPSRSHWLIWKYYARPERIHLRRRSAHRKPPLFQLLEGPELARGTRLGLQSPAPGPE
jgi:Domain of unknown function (DUF4062)